MATEEFISTTCDLTGGGTVVFDIPHSEAEDVEEEVTAFELWTTYIPG
jgi:hypothetical protein